MSYTAERDESLMPDAALVLTGPLLVLIHSSSCQRRMPLSSAETTEVLTSTIQDSNERFFCWKLPAQIQNSRVATDHASLHLQFNVCLHIYHEYINADT
jgi:hypothetical protein